MLQSPESIAYESIINSPHIYVVRRDLVGRFSYVNPAFANRFDFLSHGLIGEIFDLTVHSRDIDKLNDALSRAITHPDEHITLKVRKNKVDGDYWWVQWEMTAIRDEADMVTEVLCIGYDITESQTNSLRVMEYAKKLNTILDSITDGFCMVNYLWTITQVNRAMERTLGMKAADLVGKNLWEIFPKNERSNYPNQFRKAMHEKLTTRFEEFFMSKWFAITAYPSSDGITVLFQDISEQKRQAESLEEKTLNLEKALLESNKLSMIIRNTNDMVTLTDIKGKITWVNEAFVKTTGYTLAEVIGKKPGDLLQGEETSKETVIQISNAIRNFEPIRTEILNYSKTKEKYWIEISVQPIFSDAHTPTGFMAIQSVVTSRKENEQKILHRNKLLEEIAFIQAHEVRRPVANILGLINLIRDEDPYSTEVSSYINHLEMAAKDLDDVIHRIVFKTNEAD